MKITSFLLISMIRIYLKLTPKAFLEGHVKRLLCEKLFRESLFVKRLSTQKPHDEHEQKAFLHALLKGFYAKNILT
jgi:hypothetical protein